MKVIHAVFENGVFRPQEPVDLPEGCNVTFEPQPISEEPGNQEHVPDQDAGHLEGIYALLSRRIETGERDMAERHDEPLP